MFRKLSAKQQKLYVLAGGYCYLAIVCLFLYLWHYPVIYLSFELFLLLALLAGSIGVILRKEWGRKVMIAGGAAAVVYGPIDYLFIHHFPDVFMIIFSVLGFLAVTLYRVPTVRRFYQLGFESPSWKILLIDDDKTFVRLMQTNFQRMGVTIQTAETGEKGLEMARISPPDLVILDVILPGIKGREVCQQLKEFSETRDVPVIFLTVKDSADDVAAALETGAIAHVAKPAEFDALYREIRKILGA